MPDMKQSFIKDENGTVYYWNTEIDPMRKTLFFLHGLTMKKTYLTSKNRDELNIQMDYLKRNQKNLRMEKWSGRRLHTGNQDHTIIVRMVMQQLYCYRF